MSGFIALHRSLLDWEWYSEPNTCRVFIHCLLKANWKDKNHRGKLVKRGHFLTSLEDLAKETGLSIQNVRTAIKNLKLTHELTVLTSRQGTEIIVNNYNSYQETAGKPTHETTHETTDSQQTANKQLTTTNKGNKGNKEIKDNYKSLDLSSISDAFDQQTIKEFIDHRINQKAKLTQPSLERNLKIALGVTDKDLGISPNQVIQETIDAGWKGVNLDWLAKRLNANPQYQAKPASIFNLKNQNYASGDL